ncbi:hypothetical protein BKA63DRAFT_486199 [Paraphoma chrysanthemicola]|nr:hypothetical protein BKA63DRAFT_486199 [Paraphoma chrysanthemicola]
MCEFCSYPHEMLAYHSPYMKQYTPEHHALLLFLLDKLKTAAMLTSLSQIKVEPSYLSPTNPRDELRLHPLDSNITPCFFSLYDRSKDALPAPPGPRGDSSSRRSNPASHSAEAPSDKFAGIYPQARRRKKRKAKKAAKAATAMELKSVSFNKPAVLKDEIQDVNTFTDNQDMQETQARQSAATLTHDSTQRNAQTSPLLMFTGELRVGILEYLFGGSLVYLECHYMRATFASQD